MLSEETKQNLILTEQDLYLFLQSRGFVTNYNGFSFTIEHKVVELRDNGTYRINGDVKSQVLLLSLPNGRWFFGLESLPVSMTKTCRLIEML